VGGAVRVYFLPFKAAVATLNIINATAVAVLPFNTLR